MATVLDLIKDSLTELRVLPAGETPAPEDSALALLRVQKLVEEYNGEGLMIPNLQEDLYLLTAYLSTPTIGASGTFVATRPKKIDAGNVIDLSSTALTGTGATTGAGDKILTDATKNFSTFGVKAGRDLVYVISGTGVTPGLYRITTVGTTTLTLETNPGSSGSNISYRVILIPARSPLAIHDEAPSWWARVWRRGTPGVPTDLYYAAGFPNGTLNIYPLQDVATGLELFTWAQLTAIATTADTLNPPPLYYNALMLDLAYRLSRPFSKKPADYQGDASMARAKVKALNSRIPVLRSDVPTMGGRW